MLPSIHYISTNSRSNIHSNQFSWEIGALSFGSSVLSSDRTSLVSDYKVFSTLIFSPMVCSLWEKPLTFDNPSVEVATTINDSLGLGDLRYRWMGKEMVSGWSLMTQQWFWEMLWCRILLDFGMRSLYQTCLMPWTCQSFHFHAQLEVGLV